jgi:hypothetical protein
LIPRFQEKSRAKKNKNLLLTFVVLVASAVTGSAQTSYRRAAMIGSGNLPEGRCTVSVLVDGAADVEIRGDTATLRRVAGPAPQWHRFECTGPIPDVPASLRLRAIEGNGRMTLTQDTSSGGVAVVRITNPEVRGDEIYTFDIFWRMPDRVYQSSDADRVVRDDDSVQSCRTAAESHIRRDGYWDVRMGAVSRDNRGANDLVTGTASANSSYGPDAFTFSCRVDPSDGQIRRLDVTRR